MCGLGSRVLPCRTGQVGHRVQLHGELPQLGEGRSCSRKDLPHLEDQDHPGYSRPEDLKTSRFD